MHLDPVSPNPERANLARTTTRWVMICMGVGMLLASLGCNASTSQERFVPPSEETETPEEVAAADGASRPRRHGDVLHLATLSQQILAESRLGAGPAQPDASSSTGPPDTAAAGAVPLAAGWDAVAAQVLAQQWLFARYPGSFDAATGFGPSVLRDVARQQQQRWQDDGVWLDVPLPIIQNVVFSGSFGRLHQLEVDVAAGGGWLRTEVGDVGRWPVPGASATVTLLVGGDGDQNWRMSAVLMREAGDRRQVTSTWRDLAAAPSCTALLAALASCGQSDETSPPEGSQRPAVTVSPTGAGYTVMVVDSGLSCAQPSTQWQGANGPPTLWARPLPASQTPAVADALALSPVGDSGPSLWTAQLLAPESQSSPPNQASQAEQRHWQYCASGSETPTGAPRVATSAEIWNAVFAAEPNVGEAATGSPVTIGPMVEEGRINGEEDSPNVGEGRASGARVGVWLHPPESEVVAFASGSIQVVASVRPTRYVVSAEPDHGEQGTVRGRFDPLAMADDSDDPGASGANRAGEPLPPVLTFDPPAHTPAGTVLVMTDITWTGTAQHFFAGSDTPFAVTELDSAERRHVLSYEVEEAGEMSSNVDSSPTRGDSGELMSDEAQIDKIDGAADHNLDPATDEPWEGSSMLPVLTALGAVVVTLFVAAFLLGRSNNSDQPAGDQAEDEVEAPAAENGDSLIDSFDRAAAHSNATVAAVAAWEQFYSEVSLDPIDDTFHPDGRQYQVFVEQASTLEPVSIDMTAEVISETQLSGASVVSSVVTFDSDLSQERLYNFVFKDGESRVWDIYERIDSQSFVVNGDPGVQAAEQTWLALLAGLQSDDAEAVARRVTPETNQLAQMLLLAPGNSRPETTTDIVDPETFTQLREMATLATVESSDQALLWLVGGPRMTLMASGELAVWSAVDASRLQAGLWVDGDERAVVRFRQVDGEWLFDLVDALQVEQTEDELLSVAAG